jgi:hypothetical protein
MFKNMFCFLGLHEYKVKKSELRLNCEEKTLGGLRLSYKEEMKAFVLKKCSCGKCLAYLDNGRAKDKLSPELVELILQTIEEEQTPKKIGFDLPNPNVDEE